MTTAYRETLSIRVGIDATESPGPTLDGVTHRDPRPWLLLSLATAALSVVGNVVALLDVDRYYGAETTSLTDQAIAQDLVSLAVVAPLMAFFAWRALRDSLASYLVWLGFVGFTAYNYAIYAFSIHFGPLFLVWLAVFSTAIFALLGGAFALDAYAIANAMGYRKERLAGTFMLVMVALFGLLWLSDIVPALLDGTAPESVTEVGLPTNPVHVLDLAFFLPAVAIVGASLLQRHPLGYAAAPGVLVLMALTGLPIMTTVVVADARGHDAAWQLLGPIGVITVLSIAFTWVMVHGLRLRR